MTMQSIASHLYASAIVTKCDRSLAALRKLDNTPDQTHGPHAQLVARTVVAEIRAVVRPHEKMVSYVATLEEGMTKREDVAAELGWKPDEVSVVRKHMLRRLEAEGIAAPESDGEPYLGEMEDDEDES
jgi:hypothetical protein